MVVYDGLKMGDMSGGGFSLDNHTSSLKYYDSNNCGVGSGYGYLKSHTIL